jgi:hypothetical protein
VWIRSVFIGISVPSGDANWQRFIGCDYLLLGNLEFSEKVIVSQPT